MVWPFKTKKRKQLARLEITGAIAADTRKRVLKALKVVEDEGYPGLLLRIDSPGGTVSDSQEIYAALQRLRTKDIRTVASFGNISASGGVYIGVAAERIVANPGTITGSIGVILRGNNLERLLDKIGISFKTVKSGPYKDIFAFDRPATDAEMQILQELIDTSYQQFVTTVAEGRQLSEAAVRSFADGRIFTGQQALALGVVDRLGSEEDARRWLAELLNLDPEKTKCRTIEAKKPLARRLLPGGQITARSPWAPTLDWLEFELATSGQPLWLYRP
ncbi:MAG: signal peptide peptidase SppA [Spirulinaceae cyanobacterium SM2_1_0]|nr:signal peptide peptidase SppA [Spirulinaceae cyanobacterium SM2_1_0]